MTEESETPADSADPDVIQIVDSGQREYEKINTVSGGTQSNVTTEQVVPSRKVSQTMNMDLIFKEQP